MEISRKTSIAKYYIGAIILIIIGFCIFIFISNKFFGLYSGDVYKENKAEVLNLYNNNYNTILSFKDIFGRQKNLKNILLRNSIISEIIEMNINDETIKINIHESPGNEQAVLLSKLDNPEMNAYLDENNIVKNDLLRILNFLLANNLKGIGYSDGSEYFYILFQSNIYLKYLEGEQEVKIQGDRIMQNLGFNWYMIAP